MNWDPGVLVVCPRDDTRGAMWQRMWERAGLAEVSQVAVLPLEDWQPAVGGARPVPSHIHTIITMGEAALQKVTLNSDLFRWRGRVQPIFNWGLPCTVISTMSVRDLVPSRGEGTGGSQLLNRPARFQSVWVRDVQHAMTHGGTIVRRKPQYLLDPKTPSQWSQYVEAVLRAGQPLSFDIETQYTPKGLKTEEDESGDGVPEGAMLRIAFSNAPYTAASVPWNVEFLDGIRALLASDLPKIGWNCQAFDIPRLALEGFAVGGTVMDFQDAWHLLESDLPKGLEWVSSFYTHVPPWKHLSDVDFARYAAQDADVALQNAIGIERDLRHFGQWDLFQRHVVQLMPLLWQAGRRGNAIDMAYQTTLRADMEAEKARLRAEASVLVPLALRPRTRVLTPPETGAFEAVQVPAQIKVCSVCGAEMPNKSAHLKGGKKNPCHGATTVLRDGVKTVYDVIEAFNLGSTDQLQAYATHFKHPLGWNHKTKSPSMDKTHVAKLAKQFGGQHPLYDAVLQYSQVAKTLSTYMYTPDEQGLIHTQYVNAPSTWRLASRNYNLQNVGKRESNLWAKKARRQIVARDGHIFVQADSTSIEAVVTGHLIGDATFVAVAKKSIHAYLCCQELGWPFTDETIKRTKDEHKGLYNQFKTAVYLLLYGGDPYLMHMTNAPLFPKLADAQAIQQKIFRVMPALEQWQARVREQAKREGVLQSPWGYRHRFHDVYTFNRDAQGNIRYDEAGKPKLKLGQDAKRALAFIPQNCAGSFCRDTLLLIGASPWAAYMPANVTVHDGYTLEVPEAMASAAADFLVEILTRPVVELGGLRIGCEVDMGYNWGDHADDNPRGMTTIRKVEV